MELSEGSASPFPLKLYSLLLKKLQWPTPIVCAPIYISGLLELRS